MVFEKNESIVIAVDPTSDVETEDLKLDGIEPDVIKPTDSWDQNNGWSLFGFPISQIKWSNIILLSIVHVFGVYGFFYATFFGIKFWTIFFAFFLGGVSGLGMSVGAHRLWAHRSFKAHVVLRLILMFFQTMSGNGSIFSYARDHRTHHKYSDSFADPKNSQRGFFFAHIGWWMLKKRPEVIEHGKKVKVDDMLEGKNQLPICEFHFQYPNSCVCMQVSMM